MDKAQCPRLSGTSRPTQGSRFLRFLSSNVSGGRALDCGLCAYFKETLACLASLPRSLLSGLCGAGSLCRVPKDRAALWAPDG